MLNALFGILIVAASLGLLFYLISLLFQAFRFPLGAWFARWRLGRYVARAQRGDRLLQAGAFDRALAEFQAAFYPDPATTPALAIAVANHHTGLLSRLIAAADQLQGGTVRLLALAKVDRLLHERQALQRRYLTLRQGGSRERQRASEDEFRENTAELRAALTALAAEILSTREHVVMH